MKLIEGKYGITARILADSVSSVCGTRLRTFEICYPRLILAELNTHRMLSKNSASSRAIPFAKMKEQLTARPVRFGQANPGMQDKGEDHCELVDVSRVMGFSHPYKVTPDLAWGVGKDIAIELSQAFYEAGYHKQVYNRLTEPFQLMKTVITGTEFNNFFWLRDHEAADPTIAELARVMRLASDESTPHALEPGQYHLPYVDWQQRTDGSLMWLDEFGTFTPATWEQLRKVSAARCAAVSFRNTDYNMVKCLEVYDRLVGDERKHASAFEHQATPMRHTYADRHTEVNLLDSPRTWEDGITHIDRNDVLWSGNLRGFIQFRKLIEGENVPG